MFDVKPLETVNMVLKGSLLASHHLIYDWESSFSKYYFLLEDLFSVFQIKYDYKYVDPGPDDISCKDKRYFALDVSVLTLNFSVLETVCWGSCFQCNCNYANQHWKTKLNSLKLLNCAVFSLLEFEVKPYLSHGFIVAGSRWMSFHLFVFYTINDKPPTKGRIHLIYMCI